MTRIALLLTLGLSACFTSVTEAAPPAADQATPASLADLDLTLLDGTVMPKGDLQGKAVLFVNVASKCGYTPQYEGLQALYDKYAAKGLVIVGTPCNQFGSQEPGSPEQIASFCKMNYGVTFPLLDKQDVNGGDRSPLYRYLVGSEVGGGKSVRWNFEKFVVSPEGKVVARFGSSTTPDDPQLAAAIEAVLPKQG